jgi:hypothetical protein
MNIGSKIQQIKADLAKIVALCNEAEDFGAAQQVQSSLTTVAACHAQLSASGTEIAKVEFK